jgi:hypothetical protein
VRESAEAAIANLTAADAPLRARRQALQLDVRLGVAGAEVERDQVAAELARVEAQLAEEREVAAAADARMPEACQALSAATLAELEALLGPLEAERDALVDGIRASRLAPAAVGERLWVCTRQAHALAHALHARTRDARFFRKWDIYHRLGDWANLVPQLAIAGRGVKPPIPTPWHALLPDLEAAPTAPDAMR